MSERRMDIIIHLCHHDKDYKSYIVVREADYGSLEKLSTGLSTREEAENFIEHKLGHTIQDEINIQRKKCEQIDKELRDE